MTNRHFIELAQTEITTRISHTSILIQPLGAVEQHGAHLPLATDLLVAQAVAQAAVQRYGEELDLWLLPPLAYTKSNEHADFPGTIWLSATTVLSVLDDLGRSIAATPATKLVMLNGHGGNSALLQVACRDIRLAHGLMTFLAHPSVPPDQGGSSGAAESGMGVHGGHDETSLLLFLHPELVGDDRRRSVPDALAGNAQVRFGGSVSFGWVASDFGDSGIIGDPTAASARYGEKLFEAAVTHFGDALAEVAAFQLPPRPRPR